MGWIHSFGSWKHTLSEGFPNRDPRATASASLWSLLEIPILENHARSTESETLGVGWGDEQQALRVILKHTWVWASLFKANWHRQMQTNTGACGLSCGFSNALCLTLDKVPKKSGNELPSSYQRCCLGFNSHIFGHCLSSPPPLLEEGSVGNGGKQCGANRKTSAPTVMILAVLSADGKKL